MSNRKASRYGLEATAVAVDHGEERGIILRVDGRLMAVLIRLDAEYNGEHRGCWYLEAGFGPCAATRPAPFPRLRHGLDWIAGRLGDGSESVDAALKQAGLEPGTEWSDLLP